MGAEIRAELAARSDCRPLLMGGANCLGGSGNSHRWVGRSAPDNNPPMLGLLKAVSLRGRVMGYRQVSGSELPVQQAFGMRFALEVQHVLSDHSLGFGRGLWGLWQPRYSMS